MDDEKAKATSEAENPDGGDELKEEDVFGEDKPEKGGNQPDSPDGGKKDGKSSDDGKSARAKNAHEAEQRRLREENDRLARENAQLKQDTEKARFQAKADAVPKSVLQELGITSIESERDLKLAKAFMEADAKGSDDPKADAYASVYKEMLDAEDKKKQEEEKKAREAKAQQEKAKTLYDAFVGKFGKKAMGDLLDEKSGFRTSVFNKYVNSDNLLDVYQDYLDSQQIAPKKGPSKEAKQMSATYGNPASSPATPAKNQPSEKEINAEWEKILKDAGRA